MTDAAIRAEVWSQAAQAARDTAKTIRNITQFIGSPAMAELAVVRAEALEEFAKFLDGKAADRQTLLASNAYSFPTPGRKK